MLAGQLAHITAALFTGSAVYIFYGIRCNSLVGSGAAFHLVLRAAVMPR